MNETRFALCRHFAKHIRLVNLPPRDIMTLSSRFNLSMILVTLACLLVAGYLSFTILMADARDAVQDSARMLLEGALSVRRYTVDEVRPLLGRLDSEDFLPQTVPAYAASRVVSNLRKRYPDYSYKEAALNPTNPANRAVDWEEDLVRWFRDHPEAKEFVGERETATGRSLFISRPIRITSPACLACHGDPDKAPEALVARYGSVNGFGWKLGEIIGTQVVSVPQDVPMKTARKHFLVFMGSLVAVLLLLALALNLLLHRYVIRPVRLIADHAERVSTGDAQDGEELPARGDDEIASLARSFNRMHRSLGSAMQLIGETMKPGR